MRSVLLALVLAVCASAASGQDIIIGNGGPVQPCSSGVCRPGIVSPHRGTSSAPRRVVVRQENTYVVSGVSAQSDAEAMASSGSLRHQGHNGGCREGIGYSARSADDAIRNCCFWGRYRASEIGVARGNRGWFACVRYE